MPYVHLMDGRAGVSVFESAMPISRNLQCCCVPEGGM